MKLILVHFDVWAPRNWHETKLNYSTLRVIDWLRDERSGSNPGGDEIFRTRPDRPWDPPSLLYNGYQVFSEGEAAEAWC
jgi:hypothetical protein